jgi:hypothetical protein
VTDRLRGAAQAVVDSTMLVGSATSLVKPLLDRLRSALAEPEPLPDSTFVQNIQVERSRRLLDVNVGETLDAAARRVTQQVADQDAEIARLKGELEKRGLYSYMESEHLKARNALRAKDGEMLPEACYRVMQKLEDAEAGLRAMARLVR